MSINKTVTLEKSTTAIRMYCNSDGKIAEAPTVSIFPFLRSKLIEYDYDPRSKQRKPKYHYFRYDKKTGILHLPVNLTAQLCGYLTSNLVDFSIIEIEPNPATKINISSSDQYSDRDYQKEAISFLLRPTFMKALDLQTGCLTGDTEICFNRASKGFTTTLENAYRRFKNLKNYPARSWDQDIPTFVRSFDGDKIRLHQIEDIVYSGVKKVYRITLENGRSLKCTADHLIMTKGGWVPAELIVGHNVMCDNKYTSKSGKPRKKTLDRYVIISKNHPYALKYQNPKWNCYRMLEHRAFYDAYQNNMTFAEFCKALDDPKRIKSMKFVNPATHDVHHVDGDHYNNDPSNLVSMLREDHKQSHQIKNDLASFFNQGIPSYSRAISIKYIGEDDTYDIVCKDPHHNFVANGIVVHNSGKTYIAIRTIIEIGYRALVILPASLVIQWADAFSALSSAKVGVIRGSKTIMDLIANDYETDADIILASINTLQEYALGSIQYDSLPSFRTFIRKMRFGIKVTDECHINFHANTMIDVQSDICHNIYLSATHMRSGKNSNAIFKRIYPDTIRFDGGEYHRYVNITECHYNIGQINDKSITTNRGYSQFKYEKYLLRTPKMLNAFMDRCWSAVVDEFYINLRKDGQKLLVLVGLCDFADMLCEWFKANYPNLNITTYLHETSDEALTDADIIISTVGSCGTGRDIKGLRSLILFVSFASEALAYQTLGRLRVMEDTPEFVYMVNRGIRHQVRHCEAKQSIYRSAAKQFQIVEV